MWNSRYKSILEIILLICLLCISIFLIFGFNQRQINYYFAADVSEQYFPWWIYANSKIHNLTIPVRNEMYYLGAFPFIARGETGVFYPVHIFIHLLFDFTKDLDFGFKVFFYQQLFHYLLGGVFFFILLRIGLSLDKYPSFFGGLTYILSGSFMARLVHPPYQYSLTWYPLLFLFYLLFLRKRKVIYALLSSVVIFLMILSGHPQIIYYYFGFFLIFAFILIFLERNYRNKKTIILTLGIVIFGLIMGSMQLIPEIEAAKYTARLYPETTIKNLYNSLHPLYYLTLFIPNLFGRHRLGYWGSEYPWGNWDNYLYIGVLPFILIFFSYLYKEKKLLFALYLTGLLSVIISFGKYFWLSKILNQSMPLSESLSWVNRITMVFHFFIVLLVGIGLDNLQKYSNKYKKLIYGFIIVVFFLLLTIFSWQNRDFVNSLQPASRPPPDNKSMLVSNDSIYRSLQFYLSSVVLIGFLIYFKKNKKIILTALLMLLLVDLIPNGYAFNPIEPAYSTPEKMFGRNNLIDILKTDGSLFRVDGLGPRNIGLVQRIQTVSGYSTIVTDAYQKIIPYVNKQHPNILSLANVKYVVSEEKDIPKNGFINLGNNLWRNDKVLPRVFFSNGYKSVITEQEMNSYLVDSSYDPQDYVLIYTKDETQDLRSKNRLFSSRHNPQVEIESYTSDMSVVLINSDRDGFLFLSELNYPGWTAYIDGGKADLIPANNSFYTLPIQKGKHTIKFVFYPASLYLGLIITISTMLVTFVIILVPRYRKYLFVKI